MSRAAAKRPRPVLAQDDRALVLNCDLLRPSFSGIASVVDAIILERDTLKTENLKLNEHIEELGSKVSSLEFQEEEITRLKGEVDVGKISIDNHRGISEQFSEENKRLVAESQKIKSQLRKVVELSTKYEQELAACKLKLYEANGHIENLKRNLSKTKEDSGTHRTNFLNLVKTKDEEIAKQAINAKDIEARISVLENEQVQLKERHEEEIRRLRETLAHRVWDASGLQKDILNLQQDKVELSEEKERLSNEIDAKVHEAEVRSQASIQDLRIRNDELRGDLAASETLTKMAKDKMKEVEDIFYDPVQLENVGVSVLLNNGRMQPVPLVFKLWQETGVHFNGTPSQPIKCNQTSTMATVVHDPATCTFVTRVAKSTSLDTNLPSYFRHSARPSSFAGQLTWEEYKLYDQLTLMAKLIHMLKQPTYDSRFTVNFSEGHVVTAKYKYNMARDEGDLLFTLNVVSEDGSVHKHSIDFVDCPYAVGGTFSTRILPDNVKIVTEL